MKKESEVGSSSGPIQSKEYIKHHAFFDSIRGEDLQRVVCTSHEPFDYLS